MFTMPSKSLLIAIAAFAVTATGVQAYQGTQLLEKAGLTQEQISAFETARELRKAGEIEAARDILVEAGVDEEVIISVRQAIHEERKTQPRHHGMMGRPDFLADLSEEQRDALMVARQANDKDAVKAILKEAGIERPVRGHHL